MTGLIFIFSLLAVLVGKGSTTTSKQVLNVDDFTKNMREHLKVMSTPRHPAKNYSEDWLMARSYVEENFKHIGLKTERQCFNSSFSFEGSYFPVEGCNVIGITEGDSLKNWIIVGAHYDSTMSVSDSNPIRDNGMGAAVLIELARAFEHSVRWQHFHKNYTTIFVAFDLNTMEYETPSAGQVTGSHAFVNDWLIPKRKKMPITGAFILDSIASYYEDENTQSLPSDFQKYFQDAYFQIVNDSSRGNFIGAIGTQESKDLVDKLSSHYAKDKPYRLQEMVAGSELFGYEDTWYMVATKDARPFWTTLNQTLPAILLTDTTGPERPIPNDEMCEKDCQTEFDDAKRMAFVHETYKALSYTLIDSQTTYSPGGSVNNQISWTTMIICFAVAKILCNKFQ